MTCKALGEQIKQFLIRVPLYSPFKVGQSIIITVENCVIEISKTPEGLDIKTVTNSDNKLVIKLKDEESFHILFDSKDLKEYGNKLVELATQGKIFMDPGPYTDPMKSGFHRFIGYLKKKKGIVTFRWIIPTF